MSQHLWELQPEYPVSLPLKTLIKKKGVFKDPEGMQLHIFTTLVNGRHKHIGFHSLESDASFMGLNNLNLRVTFL